MAKNDGFVQVIREAIRDTVRNTLRSAVQEATEEELRGALRAEDIRKAILDLICQELHGAMHDLRPKAKGKQRAN
jgi:ABC-type transport system involved in cytochrome bd biosynthesis fused ATPase/permease subunit